MLFSDRQAALALQNVQTVEQLNKAVQTRVESGEAPPFEAVKVKVEKLKMQKELIRAKGAVRSAQATLNSLTAGKLGNDFSIHGEFQTFSDKWDITTLSDEALSTHPTVVKGKKTD